MIAAKAAKRYIGAPNQLILVKGSVREAVTRVPPPMLPSYVFQDKLDARDEIDNIFGTHSPLRGEKTNAPTLGQEVISQRSDLSRINSLMSSIEKGAVQVYEGITQLYKVFGTEEHMVKYAGGAGSTTFIQFSGDKIEDGIDMNIQPGSSMPDDKTTDRNQAIEMAKMGGRIDPLSFAERMHLPNPKEWAKRLVYFLWTPDRYMNEILELGEEDEQTDDAKSAINRVNSGENVPPKENASKGYLAAYNKFLRSPIFQQLSLEVQKLHMEHIRGTTELAKQAMGEGQQQQQQQQQPGLLQRALQRFGGGQRQA